jgi:hypothetical protein
MAERLIGKSRTLRDALLDVAKKYDTALKDVMQEQVDLTIDELRITTPKDTGAGAGTEQGSKRPIYKSHPGYGKHIGNNPGDTGWQLFKGADTRRWGIINPMWEPYLKEVNYTHPTDGNFLENATRNLTKRLKDLRLKKI